jgi:putative addiction module component (TIGR02574 family)
MFDMTETTREILERALTLPAAERVKLAQELLESVDEREAAALSPAWIAEIERRVGDVVAGRAGPDEDWRVVLDRIRRKHASPRT